MSKSLPYFSGQEIQPTFSGHHHTSSHVDAETNPSSHFKFSIRAAIKMNALQQLNITMPRQSCPEIYDMEIYDIDLHHLPNIGQWHFDRQFYIKMSIDDSARTRTTSLTSPKKPSSMPWTSRYVFNDVRDFTILTLEVFAERQCHDDQHIGMVQGRVEQFLRYPGAILVQLTDGRASLEFKIARFAQGPNGTETRPVSNHRHVDAVRTQLPPAVQIFDIDLHHLPRICLVSPEDRDFYVRAFVDERDHGSTAAEKLHSFSRTAKLQLNIQAYSTISLQVFAKRSFHDDQYIGMVQECVETLLADRGTKIYRLIPPDGHGDKLPRGASMEFKVMPLSHAIEPSMSRQVTKNQITDDILSYAGGCVGQAASVLTPLLEKIKVFVEIAGVFAEAHPYTKMAFMILTAVHRVVDAQFNRDQRVHRLITVIHETYSLISDVKQLKRMESQEKTINSLARQTIECSYFIRYYQKNRTGWKHCVSNVLSDIDAKIQMHELAFNEIKKAIHEQAAIHAELYIFRVHDELSDHVAQTALNAMHYALGVSYDSQEIAGAPSRTDIVDSIASWVNQDSGPQIYLLLGSDGSEKSTIAYAIARQFDAIKRLGSSYFFSHDAQDKKSVMNLFSTVARDLADYDPQYMDTLWGVVKGKRALRETVNPVTQFTRFILHPAEEMTRIGPVLVVIDGLEFSGRKSAHKDLLVALAEKGAELPGDLKFLVTCRPDDDVCAAFKGRSHVRQKHLPCGTAARNSTLDSSSSVPDLVRDSDAESLTSSVDKEPQPGVQILHERRSQKPDLSCQFTIDATCDSRAIIHHSPSVDGVEVLDRY